MKYDNLKNGQIYKVKSQCQLHQVWNPGDQFKVRTFLRRFVGTEKRFGSIPCYLFTGRITKRNRYSDSLVSIPEYSLLDIQEVKQ